MNSKLTDSNCVALSDSDYQILTINEKELLILIVTTIQDLKRNKKNVIGKKCTTYWKCQLYSTYLEKPLPKTLNLLIENEWVIISTFRNHECVSLLRETFAKLILKKEDMKEQFQHFKKKNFLEGFNVFKKTFLFMKLKHLKIIFRITLENTRKQEQLLALLLDGITFWKTSCTKNTRL